MEKKSILNNHKFFTLNLSSKFNENVNSALNKAIFFVSAIKKPYDFYIAIFYVHYFYYKNREQLKN